MTNKKCSPCYGRGVFWYQEPEGKGTGEIYKDPFNKQSPLNGTRIRKGWYEVCQACDGEGYIGKKPIKEVPFIVGQSVHVKKLADPDTFGPNTPENRAWKLNRVKESVWLASNGMLLITHGDEEWDGECEIVSYAEVERRTGKPAVKAKYYAWMNHGTFVGPHVPELIKALEEYNRLTATLEQVSS